MNTVNKEWALQILIQETEKIYALINSQKEHLCFAACPAFEEVVDTQLYGLSKQIDYAVNLGILDKNEGFSILSDLENSLNTMYNSYYDEKMNRSHIKGE